MVTALTIDVGGTKCSVAITDDDGVRNQQVWPTTGSLENLDVVREFYHRSLRAGEVIDGVGVCFGGPVDYVSSTVKRSVHVPGWHNFNFAEWAQREFGLPLAVDNDAKVGALAEFRHGGHDTDDLVYVTISTGIGAGVVSGGRLLRGATNEAGELGHTRVIDDSRVCSCGRTGCLERLCSGYWLEQDFKKPATELFLDEDFLDHYASTLSKGLATAVLVYNPNVIVLGGGVSRVGERLTNRLTEHLSGELVSWSHMSPKIVTSRFDSDGVHLGAKELVRELL